MTVTLTKPESEGNTVTFASSSMTIMEKFGPMIRSVVQGNSDLI